jgi:hypothetical protein
MDEAAASAAVQTRGTKALSARLRLSFCNLQPRILCLQHCGFIVKASLLGFKFFYGTYIPVFVRF